MEWKDGPANRLSSISRCCKLFELKIHNSWKIRLVRAIAKLYFSIHTNVNAFVVSYSHKTMMTHNRKSSKIHLNKWYLFDSFFSLLHVWRWRCRRIYRLSLTAYDWVVAYCKLLSRDIAHHSTCRRSGQTLSVRASFSLRSFHFHKWLRISF